MSKPTPPGGVSRHVALLGGMAFGMAWYWGAQNILGSTQMPLSAVPVLGALGFAAGLPALLLGREQPPVEKRFSGLEVLTDEIWIIHLERGTVNFLNGAARMRSGKTIDASVWEVFPEDQHEVLRTVLTQGEKLPSDIIHLQDRSFLPSATPVGDGVHILLMLRDVTAELAQQQAKEDFVSTVSHELRSPLTSIKGSMGLLLSNAAGDLSPSARRLLEVAHRNADRLTLIINDILDLQKIAQGGMEIDVRELDAALVVQEAVTASALFIQRFDLGIEIKGADLPVMLFSDPNRIIQVLSNLLTNAAKFSKSGGTITISVGYTAQGVRISVRDEGTGIPKSEQSKVFERFADLSNSERRKNGGSGLGLSICKEIIDKLGGKIGFESVEGVGTTFHIDLPHGYGVSRTADVSEWEQTAG